MSSGMLLDIGYIQQANATDFQHLYHITIDELYVTWYVDNDFHNML